MRLMLAEDSTLLREGLARLLADEGHAVLAAVADGDALCAAVDHQPPDVVVVDVRMPPTHTDEGLRAALSIRDGHPQVGVLVLSQYVERRYATELITNGGGGLGYLLKDRVAHVEDFLDALDRVAAGGTAFDPELVRSLLRQDSNADPLARLSTRERAVLDLLAQGHTNAGVARRLYLSQSAVEKHTAAVFDKLRIAPDPDYNRRVVAVLHYLGV